MSFLKVLILGISLGVANVATATNPFVTCSTSSNDYNFSDSSRDASLTIRQVVRTCESHSRTTNEECDANVACDDRRNPEFVTCSTSSNGYNFSDKSRDPDVAKNQIKQACTRHSRTTNAECEANIACEGELNKKMIACTTSSNGYNFSDNSRNLKVAKKQVVYACRNHSRTSNEECDANVACEGERQPEMIACTTSSNGYNFSDESRDIGVAMDQVRYACRNHSRTSNVECDANIACNNGDYYPNFLICTTSSNGYRFSDTSRNLSVATRSTIDQCKNHSRTTNAECEANIACDYNL